MADALRSIESSRASAERVGRVGVWVRRAAMGALTAVVVVALCNVVGQRATNANANTAAAALEVRSPAAVRAGLLFQAKITVIARQPLSQAQLVLGSGWIDGLTMNTEEPSPSNESSGPNGSLVFDIGSLQPGQSYVEYLEYQVNPTSVSSRDQVVTVTSNNAPVVSLHRTMTIVP
jgi:hypothetical protein